MNKWFTISLVLMILIVVGAALYLNLSQPLIVKLTEVKP